MRRAGPVFEKFKDELLAAVRSGASLDEAARGAGVNVHTVRSWLSRGRKAPTGTYGRFASEVDATRQLQRLPQRSELRSLSREELEGILAEKVRAGSVPAMRLWADLHRADFEPQEGVSDDPFIEFDPR
jgi:transposase